MEDGGAWEDALDVDDSDLPSLLSSSIPPIRPCSQLHPTSQPPPSNPLPDPPSPPPAEQTAAGAAPLLAPRRIPGPAGAVQAAMRRQVAGVPRDRGDLRVEAGGVGGRSYGDGEVEADEDFLQNPWLRALEFLGSERNGGNGNAFSAHSVSAIRDLVNTDRAPKLMGIVKSCKSNGLGDLFVTLKDPTGSIGASIHRRVLTEGNLGDDLNVGSVLILKQVAVFSPMRSTAYLNVTLNNVVKLFGKDSGPPSGRVLPILTDKCPAFGKVSDAGTEPAGRAHFLSRGYEKIAAVESQRDLPLASRTADGGDMEELRSVQILDGEAGKSIRCKRTVDDRQVEHLSGISTCIREAAVRSVVSGDARRSSLLRQGADNSNNSDKEAIQNSNFKRRIHDGRIEPPSGDFGDRMNIPSAPTPLGRGMSFSPLNQDPDQIVAEQVASPSIVELDHGKNEGPTGRSLILKTSSTSIHNSMLSKPSDSVMEPKSMISKACVAQWTDEQLSELFCDFQDDADSI